MEFRVERMPMQRYRVIVLPPSGPPRIIGKFVFENAWEAQMHQAVDWEGVRLPAGSGRTIIKRTFIDTTNDPVTHYWWNPENKAMPVGKALPLRRFTNIDPLFNPRW